MRTDERGRSMIEMLGVLAVIGVLTVGGVAGYTKAINKYRINRIKNQITTIATNIHTLYLQQVSYKGLNNKTAVSIDIVPKEMIVKNGDGKLTNIFGGEVFLGSGSIGHGVSGIKDDKKAFLIEYTGLSRGACVDIASSTWITDLSSGLMGIKVTGSQKKVKTDSTTDAIVDVSEIQFQANGANCKGKRATQGSVIACVGGTISKLPLTKAQAATACNCGLTDGCAIVFKYF